jgi:hypothetical protein
MNKTRENITIGLTFLLATVGFLLSIAQDVSNLPLFKEFFAEYSNLAGVFISGAIMTKQILTIILDRWKTAVGMFLFTTIALLMCSCATSLEGLTKDQIAKREERGERWSKLGEAAGTLLINIGGSWVQAKALESGAGYKK